MRRSGASSHSTSLARLEQLLLMEELLLHRRHLRHHLSIRRHSQRVCPRNAQTAKERTQTGIPRRPFSFAPRRRSEKCDGRMNTSPRATQEPGGLSLPLPLPTHPGRPRKGTLHAVENSGALKTLGEILLGHSAARSDNLLDRRRQNGAALAPPATFDLNRLGFRRPVLKLVTPANLTANGSADDDLEPISPLGPTRPQFIRRRVRTTDLNSPDLPPVRHFTFQTLHLFDNFVAESGGLPWSLELRRRRGE